ncbi:MAG: hypothetical protein WCA35_02070 [Kovacikia sp.]
MQPLKILVLPGPIALRNPMCGNWINGLRRLGHSVVTLYWEEQELTNQQLRDWGINDGACVFQFFGELSESLHQIIVSTLGGQPDILFCWESIPALKPLQKVAPFFPEAKAVLLIDAHPNAPHLLSELSHILRYRMSDRLIDGYIFYSNAMRDAFCRQIVTAMKKPHLVMVHPFFESAFCSKDVGITEDLKLERFDEKPHIIFTGNAGKLWNRRYDNYAKDALGEFLALLASKGVHVFVNPIADLKGINGLHHYPVFSNADLLGGRFSSYISQFDAHLIIYKENNGTNRRRSARCLSTRFAFALTSICPIVVSQTSQFVHEYWAETPFGFMFNQVDDLVESLQDSQKLSVFRSNMEKVHRSFSFEAQSDRIHQMFKDVMAVFP